HNCVLAVPYHIAARTGAGGVVPGRVLRALSRPVARAPCRSADVVCEVMIMLRFRGALLALAGLIGCVLSATAAAGQIYVMESSVAGIRVGSALELGAALTIPAGGHIRAVLPSGKTQTIKGPYTGTVADLAKGQPINEGVTAWIKNVLRTGGASEATPGATRRIPRPAQNPTAALPRSASPVANRPGCVGRVRQHSPADRGF